jgi:hypothetical protein
MLQLVEWNLKNSWLFASIGAIQLIVACLWLISQNGIQHIKGTQKGLLCYFFCRYGKP